jgi:hypothetical protein
VQGAASLAMEPPQHSFAKLFRAQQHREAAVLALDFSPHLANRLADRRVASVYSKVPRRIMEAVVK